MRDVDEVRMAEVLMAEVLMAASDDDAHLRHRDCRTSPCMNQGSAP